MKAHIKISSSYGFDHNWNLIIETKKETKSFYLGQDVKFCTRVLEMEPSYVVNQIGTKVIDEGTKGNKKLAKFIISTLKLTEEKIGKLEAWELCCQ